MDIRYEKKTKKSFNEAVESITNSLKERKFGVLWQLNFKEKMAEHEIQFPNNFMILEVCNPLKANEVLSAHIEVGYFLPCKVVVYGEFAKTYFEKIDDVNMECEVLYVTSDSCDLKELNIE